MLVCSEKYNVNCVSGITCYEMTRLAGFTARITELIKVLDDISQGHYERTMVSDQNGGKEKTSSNLKPGDGKIIIQDHIIRFDKVPLVTPNGDVLLQEMSFEVKSGENVLVCGPNGCGKSSLFRVLGELWPLFGGTMTKPEKGKLFYVPQRPYMTVGIYEIRSFTQTHTRNKSKREPKTRTYWTFSARSSWSTS